VSARRSVERESIVVAINTPMQATKSGNKSANSTVACPVSALRWGIRTLKNAIEDVVEQRTDLTCTASGCGPCDDQGGDDGSSKQH
jgi:hypothetical protein